MTAIVDLRLIAREEVTGHGTGGEVRHRALPNPPAASQPFLRNLWVAATRSQPAAARCAKTAG
eukprot:176039-Lingulodinium_polyedra.AAC.1